MNRMTKLAALAALVAAFGGCYQEVELEPWQPGDTLPIAGAYNVRDVGGYRTPDGKTVKTGLVYRSGDLNRLFERDMAYLYGELGIKTVVDFRSKKHKTEGNMAAPSEQEENPDKYPSSVNRISEDTAIDESVIVPDYQAIIENSTAYPDIPSVIDAVEAGYERIILGAETNNAKTQYKKFFEILLDQNNGTILYHCSAGKDRTGVATALLLSALGVDRETVINDYLLSAQYVADKYYPVVPYVVAHTRDSMAKGKADAQRALSAIAAGQMTEDELKESLKPKIQAGVKDGVIAGVKAGFVDRGTALATANAMSEEALNNVLQQQSQPTIEQMVNGAIAQRGGIDDMATAQLNQLKTIAAMPDANIEQYAQNAGQKIAPLVTVKREYIEAMFAAIDAKYSSAGDTVSAYLTDGTDGLGLSQAQINQLKSQYLK